MTREDLIKLCHNAPKIGMVSHEEFVDYIVVLDKVRRINGKWEKTEVAYMSVDGKVAMANEDHRRQEKKLNFEDPVVLVHDEQNLTLLVAINSEIYGRRHGIATSRKIGGSPYEVAHPWEIAETSAIGRALSAMGYGVLPGSGMASAEDIKRAREVVANEANKQKATQLQSTRPRREYVQVTNKEKNRYHNKHAPSSFQRQKIQQLFIELYPDKHIETSIQQLFQQVAGCHIDDATYNEARQVTAYLLAQKRKRAVAMVERVAS